jgi:uncharacterized damage-inducible protein DinB
MQTIDVRTMFEYLYWLRDRVTAKAAALDPVAFRDTPSLNKRDLRATLVHELDVEHSWRPKLQGEPHDAWGPNAEIRAEEFPTLEQLMTRWRFDEAEVRDWLASLSDDDLAAPTTVNGLEGHPLETYLLHVVEHGVTEFTMASAILEQVGQETGELGILIFLNERGASR